MIQPSLPFSDFNQDAQQLNPLEKCPLPFRYPGGKFYALNLLRQFWDVIKHDEYREPCVGGGSVFFAKPKAQYNWINDLDSELITTYRTIQDDAARCHLIQRVEQEIATKERWREVLTYKPHSDIDVAYKYYYMNRTSFSGKMVSPGWGYRPKRSLPPERWHERINPVGTKLEGVRCTNLDFEKVINAKPSGKKVLMYIDPPYYNPPKRKHYKHGFEVSDHDRLCNILQNTNYHFFLTYDDQPQIRKMYSWAYIYEARFFYRVDNSNTYNGLRREGVELIITNYPINYK